MRISIGVASGHCFTTDGPAWGVDMSTFLIQFGLEERFEGGSSRAVP